MNISGYNTRFFFSFISQNGTQYVISILKRGYTGAALQRKLGQAPVIRKEKADNGICGTSLELWAETTVSEEYAELYTSDAKEYAVVVDTVPALGYDDHLWVGFVTPELYSEPCIAPPYNTQIIATDGLGELKIIDFTGGGRISLRDHLCGILSGTGIPLSEQSLRLVSSLRCVSPSSQPGSLLSEISVDMDSFGGKTAYDTLSAIMQSLNATIEQRGGKWLITRESDVYLSGGRLQYFDDGVQSSAAPSEIGGAYDSDYWVVGRLSREVVPAKNRIEVDYRYQKTASILPDPDLLSQGSWQIDGGLYDPDDHYIRLSSRNTLGRASLGSTFYFADKQHRLFIKAAYISGRDNDAFDVDVIYTDHTQTKWIWRDISSRWELFHVDAEDQAVRVNTNGASIYIPRLGSLDKGDLPEFEVKFNPAQVRLTDNSEPYDLAGTTGTLEIRIRRVGRISTNQGGLLHDPNDNYRDLIIGGLRLTTDELPGMRSVVNIDNSAREDASGREIAFGDQSDEENNRITFTNYLTKGTTMTSAWSTAKVSQGDFLDVISRDMALSCALPRLRIKGIVNTPVSSLLPMCFTQENILYILDTYTWNLLEDELDCILISAPAANLNIISQNASRLPSTSGGGAGTSSSDGSLSGSFSGNYEKLTAKPTINEVEVSGNKTNEEYHLAHINGSQDKDFQTRALMINFRYEPQEGEDEEVVEENSRVVRVEAQSDGALAVGDIVKIGQIYLAFDPQNMTLRIFSRVNGEEVAANVYALGEIVSGMEVEQQGGEEGGSQPSAQGGTDVQWGIANNNFIPLTVGDIVKIVALQGHTHQGLSGGAGNATTPIYLDAYGIPQPCTNANMTVGAATKLTNGMSGLNKGSNNTPVYFVNGEPVATTNVFATQDWVSGRGFLTSLPSHSHSEYLTAITKSMIEGLLTGNITSHTHSRYAESNHDHEGVYAESSHNHDGVYLKSITKNMVEDVLVGENITSHKHDSLYHIKNGSYSEEMKAIRFSLSNTAFINLSDGNINFTTHIKVNGNISSTGEVTAGVTSDRRLKANIRDLEEVDAEEVLSRLRPVSFVWNDRARELNSEKFGIARSFIADEFLKVLPNAGRRIYGEYDAIYIEQVIPYLVKGWQSQQKKIDEQQKRIEDLEKKLERLMKIIENYEQQ